MKKLDKMVALMYKNLDAALDLACPEITYTPTVASTHWATEEHDQERKKVAKLYKKAKQTTNQTDWTAYKEADRAFKKKCKQDKNRAWRKYKESLQTQKEVASLARLAQRESRRDINVLMKEDGSNTDPGKETMDLLTETHFPAATEQTRVTYNNRRNCSIAELKDKYTDWISTTLIRKALDGFEKKKSPGPDGIKPLIFEHLPAEFIDVLELTYKASIHLGLSLIHI